jgi:CheY-like chemotaxis protein
MKTDYNFNGKNILIVEDDNSSLYLAKTVLENTGANVLSAINGETAVTLAKTASPTLDLILMDIRLPIMGGFEATQAIRKFNSKIPIIAYTADVVPYYGDYCLKSGFTAYLEKPIRSNVMLSTIDKYLK